MSACAVTATRGDRKAKAAFLVPASDRAMVQDDECNRVTASDVSAIRLTSRPGRDQSFPLQAMHEDRSQPMCLLERSRNVREAWWARSEPPDSELMKVANGPVLLDGRNVVRELELRGP